MGPSREGGFAGDRSNLTLFAAVFLERTIVFSGIVFLAVMRRSGFLPGLHRDRFAARSHHEVQRLFNLAQCSLDIGLRMCR